MHHFGMEHGGKDAARLIARHSKGRIFTDSLDRKPFRQLSDAVAMAHPHRIALTNLPNTLEQSTVLTHQHIRTPELSRMSALDRSPQLDGSGLLAIANGENGHAGVKNNLRRTRRTLACD